MNENSEPDASREIAIGARVFVQRGIDQASQTIYAYGYGTYKEILFQARILQWASW